MASPQNLLSRAVQFQIQTQRSYFLTEQQVTALSQTLIVIQLLLENLIVTRSSRPEVLNNIELLLDELQLLVAEQVSAGTSQLSSGTVKYPTENVELRYPDLVLSGNVLSETATHNKSKYGLFNDRISNISPSVSTRSINEIQEDEFEEEYPQDGINGLRGGHHYDQNTILNRNDFFRHNAERFESARSRNL